MKTCSICKTPKPETEFFNSKQSKDGLRPACKVCTKAGNQKYLEINKEKMDEWKRQYYLDNKETIQKQHKEWAEANKDKLAAYHKDYRSKNSDKEKLRHKIYYENNKDKSSVWHSIHYQENSESIKAQTNAYKKAHPEKRRAWKAKRRSAEMQRLPSYADLKAIEQIYANCPKGMVVDHIIPLQGKTISGFHIQQNLQYLTSEENTKKGNKFPYYPLSFYKEKGLLPLTDTF